MPHLGGDTDILLLYIMLIFKAYLNVHSFDLCRNCTNTVAAINIEILH